MARAKKSAAPYDRPADGTLDVRREIIVAHYWPSEGYGCGTKFDDYESAFAFARREAEGVEMAEVRADIHVVETITTTRVVRAKINDGK